jgi:hypothetical protein
MYISIRIHQQDLKVTLYYLFLWFVARATYKSHIARIKEVKSNISMRRHILAL